MRDDHPGAPVRVAVVGAGIAGLAAARELRHRGLDVLVYERDAVIGGRMSTRVRGGHAFDVGANFLVGAYRELNHLAREHGVAVRTASPVSHVVLRDGAFHRLNFGTVTDVFRMGGLHVDTRLRFLALVVKVRTRWPHLDFFDLSSVPDELNDVDAWTFAHQEGGTELADYVIDAFHTCMMFSRARDSSAAALVSLLSMMTASELDFSVQFASGDMIAIPAALASGLPVRVGTAVERVRPAPGGGWEVVTADGVERFEHVVIATPAGQALRLIEGAPAHSALLAACRSAATINVSFRVPRGALGQVHCFYVPFVEHEIISEFTNEGLKDQDWSDDGEALVNVGLHEQAALALLGQPDALIFDRVRSALLGLCEPLREVADRVLPHDLQRWPEAIPRYDADHVRRVRRFQDTDQGRAGLWLAGDHMNAPWAEGACRNGQATARRIAQSVRDHREYAP